MKYVQVYERCRGRALCVVAAAVMVWLATGHAFGDDFQQLVSDAHSEGTVSVLVTGWHAITGDEALQGSSGSGPVAITGDEFVEDLRTASREVSVVRRYEHFPVLAVRMDTAALRHAKSYRTSVEVWEDPVLEPLLRESTRMVGADDAWRRGYTGEGVAVAVIDDGADVRHPFLEGRVIFEGCFADRCPNGENAMTGRGSAFPVGTHGTHVAGIVLGRSRNDGLAGVGPDLQLVIINVANRDSRGMSGNGILGALDIVIRLARAHPGVIAAVNMSLGASRKNSGVCRSRIWDLASKLLRQENVAVAVASGNDSRASRAAPVGFPACIDGFISVGAVTKTAQVADFSNSGSPIELLAPGVQIRSSIVKGSGGRLTRGFDKFSGTSMAAPHVAAALALLQQAVPRSSVAARVEALKETGRPIRDARNGITTPLIDVGQAIAYVRGDGSGTDGGSPPEPEPEPEPEPQPRPPSREEPPQEDGEAPQPDQEKGQWTPIT